MPTTEEGLAATRRPDPLLQEIDTRPKGQASNCACLRRHLLESRMREIRTSGSTRGGAILNPPPTLRALMGDTILPVLDVNCTALYSANRSTIQSTMPDTSRRRWLGLLPAAAAVPLWGQTQGQTPPPGSGYRTHDILEYGAKGDGQTLDTAAVQRAIDACHRDRGGVVLVPAGDFLVGTLELKTNVTLHLSASGRVLGSGQAADYTAGKGVPPGNGNVVPLYAVDAENVTIEGPGTVDGQGQLFLSLI